MNANALQTGAVAASGRTDPESELDRRLIACGRTTYRLHKDLAAKRKEAGLKPRGYSHILGLVTGRTRVKNPEDSRVLAEIITQIEEYERGK
jgi:hypothetical protein